ncbi:MAG: hypothetical protein OHK0053_27260 [Microscillaceae bacterium]
MKTIITLGFVGLSLALAAQKKVVSSEAFSMEGIREIIVQGHFCQVNVIGQATPRLDFKGEIWHKNQSQHYIIRHQREGDVLKVWVEGNGTQSPENEEEEDLEGWKKFEISILNGRLDFIVPQTTIVKIKNRSGRIFVQNIQADTLKLVSSSGTIRGENLSGWGYCRTQSGRMYLQGLSGEWLGISTSGTHHWEQVKGTLQAQSRSGRVYVRQGEGQMQVEATSGTIHLEQIQGPLRVKTRSGRILAKDLLIAQDAAFEAASGAIKVDFQNPLEDFQFDLKTNSGRIKVGKGPSRKQVFHNEGKIAMTGLTRSGRQRYF